MHDYFEIVGVARNARPTEVRRACGRRRSATHPDIDDGDTPPPAPKHGLFDRRASQQVIGDAAVDFVDASTLVESIRASFFG